MNMKKNKYNFDEFFLDFICLWPLGLLIMIIIGNIIVHGF